MRLLKWSQFKIKNPSKLTGCHVLIILYYNCRISTQVPVYTPFWYLFLLDDAPLRKRTKASVEKRIYNHSAHIIWHPDSSATPTTLLHNLLLQLPSILLHLADDIFRAGLCILGHRIAVLGELVRFRLRLCLEGCFPAAVAREERGEKTLAGDF